MKKKGRTNSEDGLKSRREFLKLAAGIGLGLSGLPLERLAGAKTATGSTEKENIQIAREALKKLRKSKLLTIQDYDKINPLDQGGWPEVNAPIKEYDLNYPRRLKEYLGIEIEIARSKELNQEIAKVEEKKAEDVADMWIKEAKEVRQGVTRKDVIMAAKLYLVFKKLLKEYDADAITFASWHLAGAAGGKPKTNVMPPLAWMELSKQHIPCCCESLIDCLVTQMIGTYLTEKWAGFVGDVLNDWSFTPNGVRPKNVVIVGHCGAPITPHGDDRIPYTIRDHVINGNSWAKLFKPGETVTATTVDWPWGEVASLVKFMVYSKKVSVFTGRVLDGDSLYKNFPDTACRNKIVIEVDNPEGCYLLPSRPPEGLFRDWFGSWGCHQVVFYGDLKARVKALAGLIGFQVIESKL